jgi:hypothetical protein
MRIYIIGSDGIMLCRKAPATLNDGEIDVASNEELHAAPLSAKRLLALCRGLRFFPSESPPQAVVARVRLLGRRDQGGLRAAIRGRDRGLLRGHPAARRWSPAPA